MPKEKLLEYKLGSGWELLCEFLGKQVPDVPFPVVNETEVLNEKSALLARKGLLDMALRVLEVILPLAGAEVAVWLCVFSALSMRGWIVLLGEYSSRKWLVGVMTARDAI